MSISRRMMVLLALGLFLVAVTASAQDGKWHVTGDNGEIVKVLPRAHVFTHIEPREDPVSHQDVELRGGR